MEVVFRHLSEGISSYYRYVYYNKLQWYSEYYLIHRFLNKPALHFDDVLFSVGKICSHLVSYLTFHKSR